MKRQGFTLVEAMICILALSVMAIAMVRFGNTLSLRLAEVNDSCDVYMSEYQDVCDIRASEEIPDINHPEYFVEVKNNGTFELWKYTGEKVEFYKLYEVD